MSKTEVKLNIIKRKDLPLGSEIRGYTLLRKVDVCDLYILVEKQIYSMFRYGFRNTKWYKTKGYIKIDKEVSPAYIEMKTEDNWYVEVKRFNWELFFNYVLILILLILLILK